MARPSTPTRLKVVRGTAQHNPGRLNPAEPQLPLVTRPRPATWLRLSPLERRIFRDLVRATGERLRVLTDADVVALSVLAKELGTYAIAKQETAGALTYESENEHGGRMVRAHPMVAIGAEALRMAKTLLTEFGLTPAARAKVTQVGADEKDPLEQWLGEGTGG